MFGWGRVAAALRIALRSTPSLKGLTARRAVGSGVVGSVVGAGVIFYHNYANNKSVPFAVYAEEQKAPAPAPEPELEPELEPALEPELEPAPKPEPEVDAEVPAPQLSARKVRFNQFASVIYEDEPYMTPRDFLYSVMLEKVDRKLQKRVLTTQELNQMLSSASKARPGNDLFRSLGDNGLISYTEYLFLLTILTSKCIPYKVSPTLNGLVILGQPRTGFHIAFKMLDVDGNEHVDKKEFLTLKKIIGKSKRRVQTDVTEKPPEDSNSVNTSLQAYFFGKKGNNKLQYKEFHRFMEDLQAEVHEMEFMQFSKGMDTMRREDFAEWLLHYTNEEDNDVYWENMRKKIPAGQSITFDEFKVFCLFTNNLEDFAHSMKMVTEANRPVGMAQFKRAVKIATGHDLSENVLDTVFKLFDMDGDNCLSHKEFINVMKDRVLRGLKVHHQSGLSGYWKCVKRETLKGAKEALGDTGCPI